MHKAMLLKVIIYLISPILFILTGSCPFSYYLTLYWNASGWISCLLEKEEQK